MKSLYFQQFITPRSFVYSPFLDMKEYNHPLISCSLHARHRTFKTKRNDSRSPPKILLCLTLTHIHVLFSVLSEIWNLPNLYMPVFPFSSKKALLKKILG